MARTAVEGGDVRDFLRSFADEWRALSVIGAVLVAVAVIATLLFGAWAVAPSMAVISIGAAIYVVAQ
jgi:hypothetical protein